MVGAEPEEQRRYWYGESTEEEILARSLAVDLRGAMTLTQVVGALSATRLCLSLDNGVMHLAAAVNTVTVALFREGYDRLWAPPNPNLTALTPGVGKGVGQIEVSSVIDALKRTLFE